VHELRDRLTIGRKTSCAIRVEDPTVSAEHAEIFPESGQWWVSDLNSTNGILVNGKKIEKAQLVEGTTIGIGTHEFEFLLVAPDGLDKTLKIKKSWIPGVYYTE